MCSYLRKSPSEKDKIIECHACGETSMVLQSGETVLEDGFKIRNLERWVCRNCGEELFDSRAMKEIRRQREKKLLAV